MQGRSIRYSALLFALLIALSVCSMDADAQRRRKRRMRRVAAPVVTNPVIAPPGGEQTSGANGEKIISTADENTGDAEAIENASQKRRATKKPASGEQDMQQTINALSNQVNRLNDKLTQMQENDRSLIDMERLTRAEQRAENLRAQLIDAESKLADLQSKLEQIDYGLRPENIERAAGYGTVHPEEARDARRRQLESEKSRLQAQIRILETSRTRLETSIGTADAEVDTLRRRLEQKQQDSSGSTRTEPRPTNSRDRPE
ncbi:MAG: hypothetical protein M3Y84_13225 [Acidobacteriota bacterium]|nr:hypothetical protein [Acidobacteriota bacterium]